MAIVKRYRRRRITTVNIKILIFQIVKRRLRQSILKFEFFSTVSSAIMFLKKGGYIFLTRNSGFLYDNVTERPFVLKKLFFIFFLLSFFPIYDVLGSLLRSVIINRCTYKRRSGGRGAWVAPSLWVQRRRRRLRRRRAIICAYNNNNAMLLWSRVAVTKVKKFKKKYFKKTAQIQAQTAAATNPRTCGTASWRLMGRGGVAAAAGDKPCY